MVKKTFVNNEAYTKTEAYLTKGVSQWHSFSGVYKNVKRYIIGGYKNRMMKLTKKN